MSHCTSRLPSDEKAVMTRERMLYPVTTMIEGQMLQHAVM
jgi:hypothetical protein